MPYTLNCLVQDGLVRALLVSAFQQTVLNFEQCGSPYEPQNASTFWLNPFPTIDFFELVDIPSNWAASFSSFSLASKQNLFEVINGTCIFLCAHAALSVTWLTLQFSICDICPLETKYLVATNNLITMWPVRLANSPKLYCSYNIIIQWNPL